MKRSAIKFDVTLATKVALIAWEVFAQLPEDAPPEQRQRLASTALDFYGAVCKAVADGQGEPPASERIANVLSQRAEAAGA
ncbi:MAG: hypothetical protein ACJ74O_17765 [Frankiaceae bacterium]